MFLVILGMYALINPFYNIFESLPQQVQFHVPEMLAVTTEPLGMRSPSGVIK